MNIDELNKIIKPLDWEQRQHISDGYHTFGELYYHRMFLFLTVMRAYENRAWRSKLHHDGTMYDDMFIVGVKTPLGQYTYHYEMKYWNEFSDIDELERAPEWDGHQPDDITRLISLGDMTPAQDFRQWVVDYFFIIEAAILGSIKEWEEKYPKTFDDDVDRDLLVELISERLKDGLFGVIDTYETYEELRD